MCQWVTGYGGLYHGTSFMILMCDMFISYCVYLFMTREKMLAQIDTCFTDANSFISYFAGFIALKKKKIFRLRSVAISWSASRSFPWTIDIFLDLGFHLPWLSWRIEYASSRLYTYPIISLILGICYGYSVMESAESPNIPFTILKTRWTRGTHRHTMQSFSGSTSVLLLI